MRIQHNIMAMNAYRNYNSNTKALSGNLEKLSSGYKINRAGDDAAGLAISEKMRAQITGLDAAQKNVKDGISLVKTAEGAMQEIQDMLNRMDYLATQSANGTYDNEVDRANLQKEVNNLKTEINRIADSANFNGIKLLDGSLDDNGSVSASGTSTGLIQMTIEQGGTELTMKDVAATKGTYTVGGATGATPATPTLTDGQTLELTVNLNNGKNVTLSVTARDYTDGTQGGELRDANGEVLAKYIGTSVQLSDMSKALTEAAKKSDLAGDFKIQDNKNGTFTLTNINAGADAPQVMKDANVKLLDADGNVIPQGTAPNQTEESVLTVAQTKGTDAYQTLDASPIVKYDGSDDSVLTVNGKKFAVLVQDGTDGTEDLIKKAKAAGLELIMVEDNDGKDIDEAGDGELHLDAGNDNDAFAAADSGKRLAAAAAQGKTIATVLSASLGMKVEWNDAEEDVDNANTWDTNKPGHFSFKADTSINPGSQAGKALTLQIGDTSDKFNQMKVSIGDMHTKAMGTGKTTLDGKEINVTKTIADIDIGTQEGAQDAVAVIKNAINYVSGVRGDLGAIQNRLDHTANNLSVMAENIQDAESTIRDTDVANEMMSYVKNNILVQSAQAMLAQANQVPQGVLQLLG